MMRLAAAIMTSIAGDRKPLRMDPPGYWGTDVGLSTADSCPPRASQKPDRGPRSRRIPNSFSRAYRCFREEKDTTGLGRRGEWAGTAGWGGKAARVRRCLFLPSLP